MIPKQRETGRKNNGHTELRARLADLLTHRAQGLLTQCEYEEKLSEVECSLPRERRLDEQDLPRGGTRFILRDTGTGRVLGEFEFHRGHEVDR